MSKARSLNYTYQHNSESYSISLEPQRNGGYQVTIGERTFTVTATLLHSGALLLEWEDGRIIVHTAAHQNERYVHVNGQTLTFNIPDARSARRRTSGVGGDLTAQMPGQVVEVMVQDGEAVESGQTLVILEAMKMEIRVTALAKGIVKRVLVKKGETVDRGQHLIELEELLTHP